MYVFIGIKKMFVSESKCYFLRKCIAFAWFEAIVVKLLIDFQGFWTENLLLSLDLFSLPTKSSPPSKYFIWGSFPNSFLIPKCSSTLHFWGWEDVTSRPSKGPQRMVPQNLISVQRNIIPWISPDIQCKMSPNFAHTLNLSHNLAKYKYF